MAWKVRSFVMSDLEMAANLLSAAYKDDIFFEWCVPNEEERYPIVAAYYKVYLQAEKCVAFVVEDDTGALVGISVWLPHDADPKMYDEIGEVVGEYAPMFNAVADWSHMSEPANTPFYQLVGFGSDEAYRGQGIGVALLEASLYYFDSLGIPTYLEASTAYDGGGVYGKFGYQPVGELMVFTETAVLYPLWRHAKRKNIRFGNIDWRILEEREDAYLLLSEHVLTTVPFHHTFTEVTWANASVREYLNHDFLDSFTEEELSQILPTKIAWNNTTGQDETIDKVFLLSLEEVETYFRTNQDTRMDKFYIDDQSNKGKKATDASANPTRWFLRTPGSRKDFVMTVTIEGKISLTGDFVHRSSTDLFKVGARPVMWVKKK